MSFIVDRLTHTLLSEPDKFYNILKTTGLSKQSELNIENYETHSPYANRQKNLFKHILGVVQQMIDVVKNEKSDPIRFEVLKEKDEIILLLSAWLHDIGKTLPGVMQLDEKGKVSFPSHHLKGAEHIRKTLPQLGFDEEIVNAVAHITYHHHQRMEQNLPISALGHIRKKFGIYLPHIFSLMECDLTTQNLLKRHKFKVERDKFEEKLNLMFVSFDNDLEPFLIQKYSLKNGNLIRILTALEEFALVGRICNPDETIGMTFGQRARYYTDKAYKFLEEHRIDLNEADLYAIFKPYKPFIDGTMLLLMFPHFKPGPWINVIKNRLVELERNGRVTSTEQAIGFIKELVNEGFITENKISISTVGGSTS